MPPRAKRFAALIVIAIAAAACDGKGAADGAASQGSSTVPSAESERLVRDLRACVERSLAAPWQVTSTTIAPSGFAIHLEASSAALQLPHRPGDYRQQQFVAIALGPFREYSVVNPERLPHLIESRGLVPVETIGTRTAADLAPFTPFTAGGSTYLLNVASSEFCVAHATPASWPNPSVRCQVVRGRFSAGITFSAEALGEIPRLFDNLRNTIDRILPCLEALKERQND